MSGLNTKVNAIYNRLIGSTNLRVVHLPDTVAGINFVSDGAAAANAWSAYVQVVAAATAANPTWLLGITLGTPLVEAFYGTIAVATGAAAAEVDVADFKVGTNVWPVVEWGFPFIPCQPVRIDGSPRLAIRIRKNTAASASGFANCNLVMGTRFEG